MFRVIDKGLGWHVTAQDRVVFRPMPSDPFRALAACMAWVRANA